MTENKNINEMITDALNNAIENGVAQKIIEENVQKLISETIKSMFSYGSEAKKEIEKKLNDIMVPAIKAYDFSKYVDSMDMALTSLVNSPSIVANNCILDNFKTIMKTPGNPESVTLSDLLKTYGKYVAENIDTCGRDINYDDGEPTYVNATCEAFIDDTKSPYNSNDSYESRIVTLHTENEDEYHESMNYEIRIYRWNWEKEDTYHITTLVDPKSLRGMSSFEAYLYSLMVNKVPFVWNEVEDGCYEEIEVTPEKMPEPTYE